MVYITVSKRVGFSVSFFPHKRNSLLIGLAVLTSRRVIMCHQKEIGNAKQKKTGIKSSSGVQHYTLSVPARKWELRKHVSKSIIKNMWNECIEGRLTNALLVSKNPWELIACWKYGRNRIFFFTSRNVILLKDLKVLHNPIASVLEHNEEDETSSWTGC